MSESGREVTFTTTVTDKEVVEKLKKKLLQKDLLRENVLYQKDNNNFWS